LVDRCGRGGHGTLTGGGILGSWATSGNRDRLTLLVTSAVVNTSAPAMIRLFGHGDRLLAIA
jgi:hypothetical protein